MGEKGKVEEDLSDKEFVGVRGGGAAFGSHGM